MIVMYVGADPNLADDLREALNPLGAGVVHYRNPIKALDNIAEITPSAILYSQQDFPRHWKIMVKLVREEFSRQECVFVLFRHGNAEMEEMEKAVHLEINAILSLDQGHTELIRQFQDVYLRYGSFPISPGNSGSDGNKEGWSMVFRHPVSRQMVSGVLVLLEKTGGVFRPDFRQSIADLAASVKLPGCSIKLGTQVAQLSARVTRNTGQLVLEWDNIGAEERKLIQLVLDSSRK